MAKWAAWFTALDAAGVDRVAVIGISAGAEAWLDLSQPIPPGSGFISSSLASIGSSVLQFLAPNKYTVALPDLNLYFPLVGDSHTVV